MGLLLCFFGVDGSGKSTLARRVAAYLRARGFHTTIVWMRGTHTIASVLARILAYFPLFRGSCNPYYKVCIPLKMRRLWLWIEFISVLPVIVLRFAVPKLFGRVVVAERSFIDFLVWLVVTLRWCEVVRGFIGKSVVSLQLSLCDRVVYIRADPDTLLARRKGSPEEHLIPVQLRIYDVVARAIGAPVVDTSEGTVDQSLRKVLSIVGDGYE